MKFKILIISLVIMAAQVDGKNITLLPFIGGYIFITNILFGAVGVISGIKGLKKEKFSIKESYGLIGNSILFLVPFSLIVIIIILPFLFYR